MGHELSSLVYSHSSYDLLRAGLVVERLVLPGLTLKRRVESIRLVASNVNQRVSALDLDLADALDVAESLHVAVDCAVLSLAPKAIMSGFKITSADGAIQSAARRTTDSRMSQCFLVALAMSREQGLPGLPMPSQAVWRLLYEHCFRFPMEFDPYADLAHAIGLGGSLDGSDRKWWIEACMSDVWREWLLRLGDLFMLVCAVEPRPGLQHLEFTRRSGRDPIKNPGVRAALLRPSRPETPLAIRLYDLGHAESERIHLHAAEGTFISGGFLAQRHERSLRRLFIHAPGHGTESLKYRRRLSRHEIITYIESAAPGNTLLLANLWPETRGFVTPVRYISFWVLGLSLLGGVTTFGGWTDNLREASESTFMLMYLLPTIALGYLIQPERQPEIRWRMLAWSRVYAIMLMLISIILSLVWLVKPEGGMRWVAFSFYLVGAAVSGLIAYRAANVTKEIITASRFVHRAEEQNPPRGLPARLLVRRK